MRGPLWLLLFSLHELDHKFVRLDRVLEMWRGVLEAIRAHVQDQALVKLIVADVLRFLPAPSAGLEIIEGGVAASPGNGGDE
jgi:hypothetical protein